MKSRQHVEISRDFADNPAAMKVTRTTTVALKPRRTTAPDAVTEAILARGRAVLEAEAAAIGDACSRMGDAFVGAVQAILRR